MLIVRQWTRKGKFEDNFYWKMTPTVGNDITNRVGAWPSYSMAKKPDNKHRVREEVLNVTLAGLLKKRGLLSVPESILNSVSASSPGRKIPDIVLADLWGVRIVIEGRSNTSGSTSSTLFRDARKRVETGLSPICLAVLYPKDLRDVDVHTDLERSLEDATLRVRVISEGSDGQWNETSVDGLTDILRRSYELLVSEDVVAKSVTGLEVAIESATEIIAAVPATPQRLRTLLGVPERGKKTDPQQFTPSASNICRVASLTLVNAMVFQQILADKDASIPNVSTCADGDNVAESFIGAWSFILESIDYVPVFTIARNMARELRGSPDTDNAFRVLGRAAQAITKRRAALRHDLMGRIYHRLLADAKYLGAFYTTVPAAALLLKLTLDSPEETIDWSDVEAISKLRVADLACGTGTLLKAALQTIVDKHVRESLAQGKKPDIAGVHRTLVENGLWGLDVVEFAIHLAAAALATHEPEVQFTKMNLFTLPLGGSPKPMLGSIDLFTSYQTTVQADLFGSVTGSERVSVKGVMSQKIELPNLDFCVMNPPFVRSVGGNLLFGNKPAAQRSKMQDALKKLVRKDGIQADITAGLGAVFVALGSRFVKPGGNISLVLPRAVVSGVAWEKTRRLLGEKYYIPYVIVSHQAGQWNFSENTKLSECMIVARRLKPRDDESGQNSSPENATDQPTKVINLWKKPASSIEALTLAREIQSAPGVLLETDTGVSSLRIGDGKVGEVVLCPQARIRTAIWNFESAFSRTEICRTAFHLTRGVLNTPNLGSVGTIPVTPISNLGRVGPDRRDIHDGFEQDSTSMAYNAFWGHDTDAVHCMAQVPNSALSPLATARKGRKLRDPILMWSRSGKVLIAERLRLNTARVMAIRLNAPVLSNTWWTLKVYDTDTIPANDSERILTLWLNSTLGILSIIAARVDTEGAWVGLKKPILKALLVLNPSALNADQRQELIAVYESLEQDSLMSLPDIYTDDVRKRIDEALMAVLGIREDLNTLRRMLAQEPYLTP